MWLLNLQFCLQRMFSACWICKSLRGLGVGTLGLAWGNMRPTWTRGETFFVYYWAPRHQEVKTIAAVYRAWSGSEICVYFRRASKPAMQSASDLSFSFTFISALGTDSLNFWAFFFFFLILRSDTWERSISGLAQKIQHLWDTFCPLALFLTRVSLPTSSSR